MRTLSTTLLAAQKEPSRRPYVKVEVRDRAGAIERIAWQRLYTGTEPDSYHAVAMPGDNSLLRLRFNPSDANVYLMRVASPGPGSDFSSWQAMGSAFAGGVALAAGGAEAMLFYVAPAPNSDSVYYRQSNDYGQSWGPGYSAGAPSPASPVGWLAAAYKPNGDLALFATAGTSLFVKTRTSGVWSDWQQWTNQLSQYTGVAVAYQGDWNVAVSGKKASGLGGVWTAIYGDGYSETAGTWAILRELTLSSTTANIQFRCPSLAYSDVYRLFFVEKHTGQEAYSRPFWGHTLPGDDFSANLWREPGPFDLASEYGVAIAIGATPWLSTPSGVWQGTTAAATVEVTADVVGLLVQITPFGGRARVELDNSGGKYNSLGSGALAAIKEGSQLRISPGYYTTAGAESSAGPAFWIEGWEYLKDSRGSRLSLIGQDGWGLAQAWRARRQFAWSSGQQNVKQLLTFLLARCGLKLETLSQSSLLTGLYPAITFHPGATGADGVKRLLERVPDRLLFREERPQVKYLDPQEGSSYSYGGQHPILAARYARNSPLVNQVQVYGFGVMAEAFSWGDIDRVLARLLQVHDLNLTTLSSAQDRASSELNQALGCQPAESSNCPSHPWGHGSEMGSTQPAPENFRVAAYRPGL